MRRRSFLRVAVGGVAAVGGGTLATSSASAQEALPVPLSRRFELTDPAEQLFRDKSLEGDRVIQSFAFDIQNRRLFAVQVSDSTGGTDPDTAGDLTVTRLDFAGNNLEHMHLKGFGHGVSIGVEPDGAKSYLWTEVDARQEGSSSRGVRLARFPFAPGTTLRAGDAGLKKFAPIPTAYATTCAIDPVHQRLVMRYRPVESTSTRYRFAIYDLAQVKTETVPVPLVDLATPAEVSGTFQGYALYGRYLYLYEGNSYDASPPPGNVYITSVDVNTGLVAQRFHSQAGKSLDFREPEGMAVYRTSAGEMRLFQGFASGPEGGRRANLFYKNLLV